MSLVLWCPQCNLPLTDDEAVDGHCTICGVLLPATPHAVADEQPLSEAKPREVPPSLLAHWQLWVGSGSLVLNLVLIGVVIALWPKTPLDNNGNGQQARNDANTPEEKPKPTPDESIPYVELEPPEEPTPVPKNPELVGPPDSLKPAPVVAVKPPGFVGPPDNLKPPVVAVKPSVPLGPPDNLKRTVVVIETLLNEPNGEFVVAGLQNGKSLKLTGKVKRLKITGQISGRATLDAAQLEAQEIILEQGIFNEATVKLNAPNGSVECRGQIAGKVKLSINAPHGSVTFKENGASIMNESKLTLTAGRLDFQDRILSNVQVDATLTTGGRLKFKEIANGSKVQYKKANPKDPDVEVVPGEVTTQGELRPVADSKKRAALVGPPDTLRPPLRAARGSKVNDMETHLDDPEGEFVVESLPNDKTLKLTGKVKRLKIGHINGRATLDASQLEAQEIIVAQGIFNDATVKLNAPNGSVEFRGPLNGRVKVYVNAPKGMVTFKANSSQLTSEAAVQITAATVELNDLIHGWNTLVDVTLTAGGRLQFKELANGSRVQYKKANPNDPDLEIIPGTVRDAAELRKRN